MKNKQDLIKIYEKFPDQNPSPVMRCSGSRVLLYFNRAASLIVAQWKINVDQKIPQNFFQDINNARTIKNGSDFEIVAEKLVFSVKAIYVSELDSFNIYFNDITARKIISKFPDYNPNPVMQVSFKGHLNYYNKGADKYIMHFNLKIGELVNDQLIILIGKTVLKKSITEGEIIFGHKTYAVQLVPIFEFDFIVIYCTDITAHNLVKTFPNQNPNPVLRFSESFELQYFNDAANYIINVWNIIIGEKIDNYIISKMNDTQNFEVNNIEQNLGNRTYLFNVVKVPEFNFYLMYGTDISDAKSKEIILEKLAKYFSPQVFNSIFSGELDVKINTRRKNLTIFFSDIKGFTTLTEKLEPEQLTDVIGDYLTEMTDIAIKYGGTVDKYIGDAIMIFFGDPKTKGMKKDAISCVKMALEMLAKLRIIKKRWKEKGIADDLVIRIGIHTDICTVGNFGSQDRLDYTALGNGVNLASRLESLAKPNSILISENTFNIISDIFECELSDEINVKGKLHPVKTFIVNGTFSYDKDLGIFIDEEGFLLNIDQDRIKDKKIIIQNLEKSIKKLKS